jgi:hypothetical protein
MSRIRKSPGKIPCTAIKVPGAPLGCRSGKGKLTASDVTNLVRSRFPPKSLKKSFEVQFPTFGILGPSHE